MNKKSIDSEVLAALHVLSKNTLEGINYQVFVQQNIMNGALDLIETGYASKIQIGEDNSNYCLTDKGNRYLEIVLKFARKEF